MREEIRELLVENRRLTFLLLCLIYEAGGPITLPSNIKPAGIGVKVTMGEDKRIKIEAIESIEG